MRDLKRHPESETERERGNKGDAAARFEHGAFNDIRFGDARLALGSDPEGEQ